MAGNRRLEVVTDDDLGAFAPDALAGNGDGNNGDGGNGGPGDGDGFDPAIHIGRDRKNADGSFRRKRGRKSGGGSSGRRKASSHLDITGVQAVLMSVHAGLAGAMRNEIWAISEGEAQTLAGAIIELEKQYPSKIDPRALAWINLTGVCGAIYGTRFVALWMEAQARRKQEARPPVAGPPGASPPQDRPADVIHGKEGYVREATTFRPMPPGMIDTDALAAAMEQVKNAPRKS